MRLFELRRWRYEGYARHFLADDQTSLDAGIARSVSEYVVADVDRKFDPEHVEFELYSMRSFGSWGNSNELSFRIMGGGLETVPDEGLCEAPVYQQMDASFDDTASSQRFGLDALDAYIVACSPPFDLVVRLEEGVAVALAENRPVLFWTTDFASLTGRRLRHGHLFVDGLSARSVDGSELPTFSCRVP